MYSPDTSTIFEGCFSEENLLRIFKERVIDAKAIGLDGVSPKALEKRVEEEVEIAVRKVVTERYSFTRYKEKLIVKNYRKIPRQIAIPTIRDAIVLRALCDYLTEFFDDCRMKPPHDTIKRVASAAAASSSEHRFLRMDVVNFYPSIVHEILLDQLARRISDAPALELVSKAIATPIGFDEKDVRTIGVPQGLSISNILSMIYLHDLDFFCNLNYDYHRYVDDILILTNRDKVAEVHSDVSTYLSENLKLETHPLEEGGGKTEISSVEEGTDYLGYRIRLSGLSIRERSYKKMFRAIVGCLRSLRGTATTEQVLWKLNLIVTGCRFEERSVGWIFFFRQSTNMSQLFRMDAFLSEKMGEYGLAHMRDRVKSFVKAYREVRFNRKGTTYIPDFDNFTLADKIHVISLIRGFSKTRLETMEREEIDDHYWSILRGQVARMERETVDFGATSGGY